MFQICALFKTQDIRRNVLSKFTEPNTEIGMLVHNLVHAIGARKIVLVSGNYLAFLGRYLSVLEKQTFT